MPHLLRNRCKVREVTRLNVLGQNAPTWLQPKLLADVEFRALTGDGKLRHPSLKGIREDI
jgi:ATP-dependent DNA ligase